ncbi:MAG: hypothetical protein JWQ25_3296 [Daejeonella sp.]|nr:hypothetical protein [Daejeonella sp.]
MIGREKFKPQLWFYQVIPLLLWLGFVLLPFLFPQEIFPQEVRRGFVRQIFLINLLLLIVFYLHSHVLYPLLKINKGTIWYLIGLAALLIAFIFISKDLRPETLHSARFPDSERFRGFDRPSDHRRFYQPKTYFRIVPFMIVIVCSYCFCLLLDNIKRERTIKERENVHLKTELNFLRSQISPHFMFNVLNSMVSLARKKSELLEIALINMSNLMRYMLYDTKGSMVNLSTEVEYLKNYIDLQLLRFGDSIQLNLYITGKLEGLQIEPMLLIPFVENAFKHGISIIKDPIIDISLFMDEASSTLQFIVVNSISPIDNGSEKSSGIGLSNVKRRLILLYPNRHQIKISNSDNIFTVEIKIKLA